MKATGRTFRRKLASTLACALLFSGTGDTFAKGEITSIQVHAEPATPTTYTQDGVTYRWGTGDNLILDQFTYQNRAYRFENKADRVIIRRVDNDNATGARCNLYVEENQADAFMYAPSYPLDSNGDCDLARMLSDNIINVDPRDVFTNAGSRPDSLNNIERIDYITTEGIRTGSTPKHLQVSGLAILEKSANNPVKVAAITRLDANGNPAAYAHLTTVNPETSGPDQIRLATTNVRLEVSFMSNDLGDNPGYVKYRDSHIEPVGMAFVSQEDLGLVPNQTYYGFSIFPSDVDSSIHDLTDPATFPRDSDTWGPGDADFSAASAFYALNNPPVANDDAANTNNATPITVDVLNNDSDLDGDPLTVSIVSAPAHGEASVTNNRIAYTPDSDFTGSDSITYQIDDGNGGSDTAVVTINVNLANGAPVANDDLVSTFGNEPVSFNVLLNDSDPDGDELSTTVVSEPTHGTLERDGDTFTYTPENGFAGTDSFEYKIEDGKGGEDTAVVRISVATVLPSTSARIETGLQGHGAGGMGFLLLTGLGVLGAFRKARPGHST